MPHIGLCVVAHTDKAKGYEHAFALLRTSHGLLHDSVHHQAKQYSKLYIHDVEDLPMWKEGMCDGLVHRSDQPSTWKDVDPETGERTVVVPANHLRLKVTSSSNIVERRHKDIKERLLAQNLNEATWRTQKQIRCLEAEWRLDMIGSDAFAAFHEVLRWKAAQPE